jgi:hypothetical protein
VKLTVHCFFLATGLLHRLVQALQVLFHH